MASKKTALVTGVTEGGIGYWLARTLQESGYDVVGSVRSRGKEGDLTERGVKIIEMSIDNQESIEAGKKAFLEISPRLDLLINNAGLGTKEALVDVPAKQVQHIFQTNVFGLLWCCQAFAPIMAKQGSGIIVNVGSVAGIASVPWMGLYGATKAAVRSLSTTMDYEFRPLGIKVVHLAPALIGTPFSTKVEPLDYKGDVYDKASVAVSDEATETMINTGNGRGMNPEQFAKEVVRQLSWPEPPAEIIVGTDGWLFKVVNPYMPTRWWRSLIARNTKSAQLKPASS